MCLSTETICTPNYTLSEIPICPHLQFPYHLHPKNDLTHKWLVPQIKYFPAPHCRAYLPPPHPTQNIANPGVQRSCEAACWKSSHPQQGNVEPFAWVQLQSRMCDRVTEKGRKMLSALLVGGYLRTEVAGQAQRGMCPLLCMQSWMDAGELQCCGPKPKLRSY